MMNCDAMMARIRGGAGIVAALDQSGGSAAGALAAYGARLGSSPDEAHVSALIHEMRVRIISAPIFSGRKVLAAILFTQTMAGTVNGHPVPSYLHDRGVIPFLKVDQGLAAEVDGVQLMKPIAGLDAALQTARQLGVLGTKMRSLIRRYSPTGIAAIVEQQFAFAEKINSSGLLPILEPEVSLDAPDRAAIEVALAANISRYLDALGGDRQVVLKLTLPEKADFYAPLAAHHRVARLLALSGGLSREDACSRLAANQGMIASFSRALVQDLRHDMTDTTFAISLELAVNQIFTASAVKEVAFT